MNNNKEKGAAENENVSHADQVQAEPATEENETTENSNPETTKEEKTQVNEMAAQVAALNDKYLRLYSEFENYRRRTAKEKLDLLSNAGADIVRDLLPVLDDFDRALQSIENTPETEAFREGMVLIQNKLMRTLEQKGLSAMDSKGKEFDTEYHEAITNIPAPTPDQKGKVVDVAEKGYFFKEKVLRFAKVIVGQ